MSWFAYFAIMTGFWCLQRWVDFLWFVICFVVKLWDLGVLGCLLFALLGFVTVACTGYFGLLAWCFLVCGLLDLGVFWIFWVC